MYIFFSLTHTIVNLLYSKVNVKYHIAFQALRFIAVGNLQQ